MDGADDFQGRTVVGSVAIKSADLGSAPVTGALLACLGIYDR